MITWSCKSFTGLSNAELYRILQLRNEVFIVEQNTSYQDCDDKDQHCFHLMALEESRLVAYSRLIPPGIAFENASIGRVLTAEAVRGKKVGRELMVRSIALVNDLFKTKSITIGAQLYLKKFYQSMGFIETGNIYLEDTIEHIKMHLN